MHCILQAPESIKYDFLPQAQVYLFSHQPAFAIRNLKVSGERQNYSFDLNESQGHEVHSSDGKILGWVCKILIG